MRQDDSLLARLDQALAMDARNANDREWSDLLAVAMDAREALAGRANPTVRNADAMAPVIQADRVNAYALMIKIGRLSPLYHDAIMRGEWDEASDEIQAFARHRAAVLSPADGDAGVELSAETANCSRAAVIEDALRKIAEGDEPRPVGTSWFPDGRISKHDKCTHGIWMYETCGNCIAEFALAALDVAQEGRALTPTETGEQGK